MAFLMITPPSWGSPFGLRPWQDISYFYSLMAIGLSVLVTLTVASEFYRGGKVISGHTGQGMFASMVQLTHRNTRRYGGYIVHFGVVVVIIGLAGAAFNQDKEAEEGLAYGDKMTIGSYTLVCRSYTQDDNPNYASEWAIIDVYQNGKQIDTLTPERRFYKASQQTSTMPFIRSTFKEDLYLVYEGQNEKRSAHYQSALEPAGHVDLARRLDHPRRHRPGPGPQRPSPSPRPSGQTDRARRPSRNRRLNVWNVQIGQDGAEIVDRECRDSRPRLSTRAARLLAVGSKQATSRAAG